ncbi:hypothetical protein GGI23_000441 [Coemansia sp. RSA 2559]|nr:hypothetical protein GGI23_000441 [Coemansia sp. RSA 2559]KAJ2869214.1 hypothetical protein GGI22_000387 [Coemansia erecta]
MSDNRLVAVVTGANRGIGKAIVRQLLLQTEKPVIVYLTARSIARGQAAFDDLRREQLRGVPGPSAHQNELRFHQLDVSDLDSISAFIDYLVLMHGTQSIDILINNAGGVVKREENGSTLAAAAAATTTTESATVRACDYDTAYKSVQMNYFTAVNMTTLALPHMRRHGRVLFMVTALAHLGIFSGDLPKVLASDDLDLTRLHIIENGFVSSVGKGTFSSYGFPPMPFAVSKAGLIAYARMLARSNSETKDPRELLFAAVCPGYVKTDMTGPYATLTPDQGAGTPVYIALTDDKRIRRHNGGLWKHFKPLKW